MSRPCAARKQHAIVGHERGETPLRAAASMSASESALFPAPEGPRISTPVLADDDGVGVSGVRRLGGAHGAARPAG